MTDLAASAAAFDEAVDAAWSTPEAQSDADALAAAFAEIESKLSESEDQTAARLGVKSAAEVVDEARSEDGRITELLNQSLGEQRGSRPWSASASRERRSFTQQRPASAIVAGSRNARHARPASAPVRQAARPASAPPRQLYADPRPASAASSVATSSGTPNDVITITAAKEGRWRDVDDAIADGRHPVGPWLLEACAADCVDIDEAEAVVAFARRLLTACPTPATAVSWEDGHGHAALHILACRGGSASPAVGLLLASLAAVVVENGADVDKPDPKGYAPLHLLVLAASSAIGPASRSQGANPSSPVGSTGVAEWRTPQQLAHALLDGGANWLQPDASGRTAFDLAEAGGVGSAGLAALLRRAEALRQLQHRGGGELGRTAEVDEAQEASEDDDDEPRPERGDGNSSDDDDGSDGSDQDQDQYDGSGNNGSSGYLGVSLAMSEAEQLQADRSREDGDSPPAPLRGVRPRTAASRVGESRSSRSFIRPQSAPPRGPTRPQSAPARRKGRAAAQQEADDDDDVLPPHDANDVWTSSKDEAADRDAHRPLPGSPGGRSSSGSRIGSGGSKPHRLSSAADSRSGSAATTRTTTGSDDEDDDEGYDDDGNSNSFSGRGDGQAGSRPWSATASASSLDHQAAYNRTRMRNALGQRKLTTRVLAVEGELVSMRNEMAGVQATLHEMRTDFHQLSLAVQQLVHAQPPPPRPQHIVSSVLTEGAERMAWAYDVVGDDGVAGISGDVDQLAEGGPAAGLGLAGPAHREFSSQPEVVPRAEPKPPSEFHGQSLRSTTIGLV